VGGNMDDAQVGPTSSIETLSALVRMASNSVWPG
jgi:hypothetical protein